MCRGTGGGHRPTAAEQALQRIHRILRLLPRRCAPISRTIAAASWVPTNRPDRPGGQYRSARTPGCSTGSQSHAAAVWHRRQAIRFQRRHRRRAAGQPRLPAARRVLLRSRTSTRRIPAPRFRSQPGSSRTHPASHGTGSVRRPASAALPGRIPLATDGRPAVRPACRPAAGHGLHQAGTDDALHQVTAARHQPPAQLKPLQLPRSAPSISPCIGQRACAGGIDHQAMGRHRHQDAVALGPEWRHEVVRIGQLTRRACSCWWPAWASTKRCGSARTWPRQSLAVGPQAAGRDRSVMVLRQLRSGAAIAARIGLPTLRRGPGPVRAGARPDRRTRASTAAQNRCGRGQAGGPAGAAGPVAAIPAPATCAGAPHHDGQHQKACRVQPSPRRIFNTASLPCAVAAVDCPA